MFLSHTSICITLFFYLYFRLIIGSNRGEPRGAGAVRSGNPQKVLPIEIPAIPLDELNKITGNFGSKALIGEGSYGRVFHGKLSNGTSAAIKMLDTSSSQEPDSDFTAQVKRRNFSSKRKPSVWTCYIYI